MALPKSKWEHSQKVLETIFFGKDGFLDSSSLQLADFWLFVRKFEIIRSRKGNLPIESPPDPQYPSFYDGRYKIRFAVTDDDLKKRYLVVKEKFRRYLEDVPAKLHWEDVVSFKFVIQHYLNFIEKEKVAKLVKLKQDQASLPIKQYEEQIVYTVKSSQVTIVAGDTGCGKSTQVPQYLLKAGFSKLACTQPRRIACISLAKRVSYETLNAYGSEVAYQVRFESSKNRETKILFLTEGLLLRQFQTDPTLSQYDVVVVDEVHERHLNGDFLLGVLKCLLQQRSGLKLVLMSATINICLFASYFENAPVIQVPGRLYPIELQYLPHYLESSERSGKSERLNPSPYLRIMQLIDGKYPEDERGDLLVFLSGMSEIAAVVEAARLYAAKTKRWIVLPLHSSLSIEDQEKVFDVAPVGVRKCIVSTNIAETSITIDGVRFIADSGKVKEMNFDPHVKMQRLQEFWISQASAEQRKGRAGRTGPGVCFRLYAESDYGAFSEYSTPEIQRVPLDSLVLQMASLGLRDATLFPFIDPPPKASLVNAAYFLRQQNALTPEGDLTPIGRMLARLPVDVVIGKMLIMGSLFSMVEPVLVMAAALSVQSPLTRRFGSGQDHESEHRRKELFSPHGDPFTLLNAYDEWILVKADRQTSSRKWCRRRGLEEQRFYEMSKLKRQFEDLLRDYGLLKNPDAGDQGRVSNREEQRKLRKLKKELSSVSRPRKMLKLDSSYGEDGGGGSSESDEDSELHPDLHDIDFKLRHDLTKLEASSKKNRRLTLRDVNLLKLIVSSGLFPQVVVADEANSWRKESEQVFHGKEKQFLMLHPTGVYALRPEYLESLYDEVDERDGQPIKVTEGRYTSSKELLVYVSLLETNKAYVVNTMKVPALQTLLLLSSSLDTNSDCTRVVCCEWLELSFEDGAAAQGLISNVVHLRAAWDRLLEEKLLIYESEDSSQEIPLKLSRIKSLERRLSVKLAEFMDCETRCKLRRVSTAEARFMYMFSESQAAPDDGQQENDGTLSAPAIGRLAFSQASATNPVKGGTCVTPYLTYGCLQDCLAASLAAGQAEYLMEHYHCSTCGEHLVCTVVEKMKHAQECEMRVSLEQAKGGIETDTTTNSEQSSQGHSSAFRKLYHCSDCKRDFEFTATEILKHKKSHVS